MAWTSLLPLFLMRLWVISQKPLSLSPFKLMYKCPFYPPESPCIFSPFCMEYLAGVTPHPTSNETVCKCLLTQPKSPTSKHSSLSLQPGDWVWITDSSSSPLQPKWMSPHQVILTTLTGAKLTSFPHWMHHSKLKRAPDPHVEICSPPNYSPSLTGPTSLYLTRIPEVANTKCPSP